MGLQWVATAAIAPMAAHTGRSTAPTTPMVSGISTKVSPFSFSMMIRRMFPSRTSSLIFPIRSSPRTSKLSSVSPCGRSSWDCSCPAVSPMASSSFTR